MSEALRNEFAMHVLQGMVAGSYWADKVDPRRTTNFPLMARLAFDIADAAMAEREARRSKRVSDE